VRLLGFDLGLHCGIAFAEFADNGAAVWDSWTVDVREAPKMEQFLRLADAFDHAISGGTSRKLYRSPEKPTTVYFEIVRGHRGTKAAHAYGGGLAVLQMVCHRAGVRLAPVEVSHVKREATGKGNAKKVEMVEAARKRWGFVMDENEADARYIIAAGMTGDRVK
jgi:hypothetical protein